MKIQFISTFIILLLIVLACEKPSGVESTESIPEQGDYPLPDLSETDYRSLINSQKKYKYQSEAIRWSLFEPLLEQA